jgi:hypothetical protein
MKKYLFLLVVTLGLTIAHAQVIPKNKPESNAELKSTSANIDTTPPVIKRVVMFKDSVFIYDRESLVKRVAAKDWSQTPIANKIPAESNLSIASPANRETRGPALKKIVQVNDSVFIYERESLVKHIPAKEWPAAEKSTSQPEYTIAVKKNDSVYVFRNGTLLNKRADKSNTSNQSIRAAVVNDVPIPVLLQHK